MKYRNKNAFTLVETLVTVLISTVLFAGIYSTYAVGNKAWAYYSDTVAARRETRRALQSIVNEVRAGENVRVIQNDKSSAIHFYLPFKGPVSYIWDNRDGGTGRIIRRQRLSTRIIANDISELSFRNLKDAIDVKITASKQMSNGETARETLGERVTLRPKTHYFQ